MVYVIKDLPALFRNLLRLSRHLLSFYTFKYDNRNLWVLLAYFLLFQQSRKQFQAREHV